MTTEKFRAPKLPHHTLVGYGLCLELVRLVASVRIIAGALGVCSPADVQAVLTLVLRIRRVFSPLLR